MGIKGLLKAEKFIKEREDTLARQLGSTLNPDDFPITQPGPQTAFYETTADIAIYGGAAGGEPGSSA